jgi:hypothetical protein
MVRETSGVVSVLSTLRYAWRGGYRPAKKLQQTKHMENVGKKGACDSALSGARRWSFKILSVPRPSSEIQNKKIREATCTVATC